MAFSSFGNPGSSAMGMGMGNGGGGMAEGGAANAQLGPELSVIQTEGLGFLSIGGDSKIQLLPTPWPTNNLPPPTSSLMSIASRRGLIAAAGPDVLIVATTDSVRQAFEKSKDNNETGKTRAFQPQLAIPMPMRISHVAFSADESLLVLAAEVGGGLAVYDVAALLEGRTQTAFELPTNGQAVRALVPNPTPETGEFFAIITSDGNLSIANLKEKSFISGSNGIVLKDGVSCLSWSAKGKQLIAGLANGTAYQMTPDGTAKGEIPKPPGVDNDHHLSSITWLENTVFMLVHTPTGFDNPIAPSSVFHVATKTPPSNYTFQKIAEPAPPFGLNRSPPHHFFLRLREFPPSLQDLLIVGSTASSDIGLFTKSKVPLAPNGPTEVFTMTEMANDPQRAQLPMDATASNDTSPIGFALDLSSKETVFKPFESDEKEESKYPLPALMVLNNEGVLVSWWIVYKASILQDTMYPGLTSSNAAPQITPTQPATSAFATQTQPAFGATPSTGAFGSASALGQRQSAWGNPSTSPVASGAPAFAKPAPTAALPPGAFGKPAFGATSTPTFGSSGFGPKPSPWGSTAVAAPAAAFGSSGLPGQRASPWGAAPSASTATPQSDGFASFASKPTAFAAAVAPQESIFGAKSSATPQGGIFGTKTQPSQPNPFSASPGPASQENAFGQPTKQPNIFGTNSAPQSGVFGQPSQQSPFDASTNSAPKLNTFGAAPSSNPFAPANKPTGAAISLGGDFQLTSSFKPDNSINNEGPEEPSGGKSSFFGGIFGSSLADASKTTPPTSNDAEMDSTDDRPLASTPAPAHTALLSSKTSTSIFGSTNPNTSSTPATKPSSGFLGNPISSSTPSKQTPAPPSFGFDQSAKDGFKPGESGLADLKTTTTIPQKSPVDTPPKIKEEPDSPGGVDAPLPPDPVSKTARQAIDTSWSSLGADAPLPPFAPSKATPSSTESTEKKSAAIDTPPSDVPGGPEDDGESGFSESGEEVTDEEAESGEEEGSGEDVTKDLSPVPDVNEPSAITPESSFGGLKAQSPINPFQKADKPSQAKPKQLFGEVGTAPVLPPPNQQYSPRSPSPIRSAIPPRMSRPDQSRSVSAPNAASQILGSQRLPDRPAASPTVPKQSTYAMSQEERAAEERRKASAKERQEAEEAQALVDEEDLRLQEFLSEELQPTKKLADFVAHVETTTRSTLDSIPAQVEAVYRDINSMIDTLGLNARTLNEFIKGHETLYVDQSRTKEDLEFESSDEDDDWSLEEIKNLTNVVGSDLTNDLQGGSIKDMDQKLKLCGELQKDLTRLYAKRQDLDRLVATQRDPDLLAMSRAQPLSAEQAAQQHDVRKSFTRFQKLLSGAEEALTVLKAQIASQTTSDGTPSGGPRPTMEAVMRTIGKMTSMAEKKNGDMDVLEGQLRKVRLNSTNSIGSREGSPFATPRSSVRNAGTANTYGLFYTPDSIKGDRRGFHDSIMSSTGSISRASPDRRKLSGYSVEEKAQLRAKLARKKEVTNRLREAMLKAGPRIRLMDDDE